MSNFGKKAPKYILSHYCMESHVCLLIKFLQGKKIIDDNVKKFQVTSFSCGLFSEEGTVLYMCKLLICDMINSCDLRDATLLRMSGNVHFQNTRCVIRHTHFIDVSSQKTQNTKHVITLFRYNTSTESELFIVEGNLLSWLTYVSMVAYRLTTVP